MHGALTDHKIISIMDLVHKRPGNEMTSRLDFQPLFEKRARETKTEREGEAEIKLSWPHKQGNYIISHCKLRATFI